ncbi:MAG: hypothetical protein GY789_09060 [Hyphomicrobiales bacterium]|nr:hypothetical protein [Hyphomicrobiales bacterium]MCP4998861.1 hypothetical protein [Hyphomicrobiales bacterium]
MGHPQGATALRAIAEMIEGLVLRGCGHWLIQGRAIGNSAMAVPVNVG